MDAKADYLNSLNTSNRGRFLFCLRRLALMSLVLWLGQAGLSAASLPAGFSEAAVASPAGTDWNGAVGMSFEDNGRMYVWEQAGRVWLKEYGSNAWTLLIDITEEVGAWRDFGMLGFTLDPDFRANGYIYLMYVVDRHHLLYYGTPSYDPAVNEYFNATIGRITRYTARAADGFRSVAYVSR